MVMIHDHIQVIYSVLNLGGGLRFFPIASSSTLPSTAPKLTTIRSGSKRFINPGQVTITFHIVFEAHASPGGSGNLLYAMTYKGNITSLSIDMGGFPEKCKFRIYRIYTYREGYPRSWYSSKGSSEKEFEAGTTHWEKSSVFDDPLQVWDNTGPDYRYTLDTVKKLYNEDYVYYLEVSVYGKTYTMEIQHDTDPNSWGPTGQNEFILFRQYDKTFVIKNYSIT